MRMFDHLKVALLQVVKGQRANFLLSRHLIFIVLKASCSVSYLKLLSTADDDLRVYLNKNE